MVTQTPQHNVIGIVQAPDMRVGGAQAEFRENGIANDSLIKQCVKIEERSRCGVLDCVIESFQLRDC